MTDKQNEVLIPASLLNAGLGRVHIPKGGMCCTCKKSSDNCTALEFKNMPVIGTTATGFIIVRCTEHDKAP